MNQMEIIGNLLSDKKVNDAVDKCKEIITDSESNKNWELLADSLHYLASILDWYKSEYSESIQYYKKEIEIREENNLSKLDTAYLGLAIVVNFLNDNELVMDYAKKVISISKDKLNIATAQNIIGDILLKEQNEDAGKYLLESEQNLINLDNDYMLCHVRLSLCLFEAYHGNLKVALSNCMEQMEACKKINQPGVIGTAYLRLSEIYKLSNNQSNCEKYAIKAYEIGQKNNWEIMCQKARKLCKNIYQSASIDFTPLCYVKQLS